MSYMKNESRTSAAYGQLRAEILSCRLRPGEKLTISELCTMLDVSLGAVREALSRLTSEGLVTSEPHKGFRVTPITQAELEDITSVRATIETLCLEGAIANGDLKWETGIVSAVHELSRIPLQDPSDPARANEDWAAAHARYHEALVAGCKSEWLLRIRRLLYTQSERYRRFSLPLDTAKRDVAGEHAAIAAATLERNGPAASAHLREHLQRTTRILVDSGVVNTETDQPTRQKARRAH